MTIRLSITIKSVTRMYGTVQSQLSGITSSRHIPKRSQPCMLKCGQRSCSLMKNVSASSTPNREMPGVKRSTMRTAGTSMSVHYSMKGMDHTCMLPREAARCTVAGGYTTDSNTWTLNTLPETIRMTSQLCVCTPLQSGKD